MHNDIHSEYTLVSVLKLPHAFPSSCLADHHLSTHVSQYLAVPHFATRRRRSTTHHHAAIRMPPVLSSTATGCLRHGVLAFCFFGPWRRLRPFANPCCRCVAGLTRWFKWPCAQVCWLASASNIITLWPPYTSPVCDTPPLVCK